MMKQRQWTKYLLLLAAVFLLTGCGEDTTGQNETAVESTTLDAMKEYSGEPYVVLDNNEPNFTEEDLTEEPFETYAELDSLGRCGVTYANICQEIMPTEKRGEIGRIKPTGWHTANYHELVDGNYLYNRCHLIGFQLAGENANEKNLITGTRYMNVDGMLPFENMVADYVHETNNHVLYRVTPIFSGENLVADGVEMEALSVEDEGEGVKFHVFCYNVQPGITIDYATGESWRSDEEENGKDDEGNNTYIINRNTKKFHTPDCPSVEDIKENNKKTYKGSAEKLEENGYEPCQRCHPN